MRTELPTLYKKDTTGKIRQWTIIADDNKFGQSKVQLEEKLLSINQLLLHQRMLAK